MAQHLARIHGTEEDKVNCPFYFKIGACRHGDRCSRLHHRPAFSPSILIKHIYRHPSTAGVAVPTETAMDDFLTFFEDFYMELSKFGRLEGLHVVDNVGDHMIGHVYAKFSDEEEAADAIEKLQNRFYDGIVMQCEYSPVTDFREARCRDYDEDTCSRAGFCNFLHVKPVPMPLIRSLQDDVDHDRRLKQERDNDHHRSSKRESKKKRKREKKEHKRSKRSRRSRSRSRSSSESSKGDDHYGS